jgi:hypothetical protein
MRLEDSDWGAVVGRRAPRGRVAAEVT